MKTLNYEKVFNRMVDELGSYLRNNNLKSMILGISGGIDSTVVSAIANEVQKKYGIKFIGRSLPIRNKEDEFDTSKLVGEAFCEDFKVCRMGDIYERFYAGVCYFENPNNQTPIANGNIQARLRMIYLYNLASVHRGIVLSTDNQTEYQLGFWTIHGDVGDFNPLFGLWKHEVYGLANWLLTKYSNELEENKYNAIKASIGLTPTDGLGISNSDLEQIGAKSYNDVDDILMNTVDTIVYNEVWDNLLKKYGDEVVKKVWERHILSSFKRKNLPIVIERKCYE